MRRLLARPKNLNRKIFAIFHLEKQSPVRRVVLRLSSQERRKPKIEKKKLGTLRAKLGWTHFYEKRSRDVAPVPVPPLATANATPLRNRPRVELPRTRRQKRRTPRCDRSSPSLTARRTFCLPASRRTSRKTASRPASPPRRRTDDGKEESVQPLEYQQITARDARELATKFKETFGGKSRGGRQLRVSPDSPDIQTTLPGIRPECKRVERFNACDTTKQTTADAADKVPVAWRREAPQGPDSLRQIGEHATICRLF